jgi:DNA-binding NtrC family response regulator
LTLAENGQQLPKSWDPLGELRFAILDQIMGQPSVVVFENGAGVADAIGEALICCGMQVVRAPSCANLASGLAGHDLVILGPSIVRADSIQELAQSTRQTAPGIALLVIASKSSEELAIAALRAGINEYVKCPFTTHELIDAVRRCLAQRGRPVVNNCEHIGEHEPDYGIVGNSAAIREVRTRMKKMAATSSNILITGETGTGKELVAELVHKHSPRRQNPLVTLNCAAIPDSLLESELFGYERGAFTGAASRQEGKVKAADGGSVFLDEIGEMSPYGQAKLLRMIEGKEIQRLGRNGGIAVDIRIIAATNQDLEVMVSEGRFRKDLFFRLNVARIHVPPLRERKEDLPVLIAHYIQHFNAMFGRNVERLSEDAMEVLLTYEWPGNVRELKNLLEAIFVELPADGERYPELPLLFRRRCEELRVASGDERDRLLWALTVTNWNKSKAASKLSWSRMTLYRKMARYKIV